VSSLREHFFQLAGKYSFIFTVINMSLVIQVNLSLGCRISGIERTSVQLNT